MVTVLLVDIESAQGRPTTESVKTLPREYSRIVATVATAVEQCDGMVHHICCGKIIAVWGLLPCQDAETTACHAAVSILRTLSDYTSLRCAVVTGDAAYGVVGTHTMKTNVILGQAISVGEYSPATESTPRDVDYCRRNDIWEAGCAVLPHTPTGGGCLGCVTAWVRCVRTISVLRPVQLVEVWTRKGAWRRGQRPLTSTKTATRSKPRPHFAATCHSLVRQRATDDF